MPDTPQPAAMGKPAPTGINAEGAAEGPAASEAEPMKVDPGPVAQAMEAHLGDKWYEGSPQMAAGATRSSSSSGAGASTPATEPTTPTSDDAEPSSSS